MGQVPHAEILVIKTICDFGICARADIPRDTLKRGLYPNPFLFLYALFLHFLSASHPMKPDVEFSTYALSTQVPKGGCLATM